MIKLMGKKVFTFYSDFFLIYSCRAQNNFTHISLLMAAKGEILILFVPVDKFSTDSAMVQ